ncbi:hypothetical protein BU17DRAFT_57343 [Hysterangium stoloniferum]|nr:hypothetical protein BU17DRAFT_57343 [Hysterangium stoloniferum]
MLENVKILQPTYQVVSRMIDASKSAAALISTYRKQSRIARRLSFGNRDKFVLCAETLQVCSSDLLMSLQIHQTSHIDILSRSVPVDPNDEAARMFISQHGSLETVVQSPELVAAFAKQEHLPMDDKIMDQLNVNIADTLQQTESRLEGLLKENVNTALVDGLKGLAQELNAAEAEQRFICVQCDKEFRTSTNGPKSCSFHLALGHCCSSQNPCQFSNHRANHHCDYTYTAFFDYAAQFLLPGSDTVNWWVKLEDPNLEFDKDNTSDVAIGALLRWKPHGALIPEPVIIIKVGTVWYPNPYYLDTFTAKQLESIGRLVNVTQQTLIFRTSPSTSEFSMAEWELSSAGEVVGVRLTAKAATSDIPYVRICPIDLVSCTKSGDIISISDGGITSYKPQQQYILPKTIRVGPDLPDKFPVRATRKDFKTRSSPALPVVMKSVSDPAVKANPDGPRDKFDVFKGTVSVFNKSPTPSDPITIASVSAVYRFVGDEKYVPVGACEITGEAVFPMTLQPRQSIPLNFQILIPRSEEDVQLRVTGWRWCPFTTRYRPLRLKLILTDMEDEECSLVIDYVFDPGFFKLEKPKETDLAFFYFDDYERFQRRFVRVRENTENSSKGVVIFENTWDVNFSLTKLQKYVHYSLKTGETEVEIEGFGFPDEINRGWSARGWVLVDISCRRVYAFKALLLQNHPTAVKFGCLAYVLCPSYGNIIEEPRPIRYAKETHSLPKFAPYDVPEIVLDDSVDDFVAEPRASTTSLYATDGSVPMAQMVVPETLTRAIVSIEARLAAIDTTLANISRTFERYVQLQEMQAMGQK